MPIRMIMLMGVVGHHPFLLLVWLSWLPLLLLIGGAYRAAQWRPMAEARA